MPTVMVNDYKLMRARHGRMLGGVAAGLARASGLDVTVVRLCIGATMLSGFGFAAYILMWIILPEESPRRGEVIEPAPESAARIIRIALIGLAALSLVNKAGGFFAFTNPHARGIGPDGAIGLILLGIGISILFSRHRPDRSLFAPESSSTTTPPVDDDDRPMYTGPLADAMGEVHEALSDAWKEVRTTVAEAHPRRPSTSAVDVDDDVDDDYDDYGYYDEPYDTYARATQPTRSAVATVSGDTTSSGGVALGFARVVGWLALIWFTLASLAIAGLWKAGAVTVGTPLLLVVTSLVVFSAVTNVLVHAKFASAVLPSLLLLLIPVAIGASSIRAIGAVGEQIVRADTLGATSNKHHAVGRLELDYAQTDFTENKATVNASVGVGAIFVTVPDDAEVTVHTRTDVGQFEVFGVEGNGGLGNRDNLHREGCEGGPKLTLNLRAGIGYVEVHRSNGHNDKTCKKAA